MPGKINGIKLNEIQHQRSIKTNTLKTKIVVITKRKNPLSFNITIDGVKLEEVTQFCYRGSLPTEDASCQEEEEEIKRKLAM